MDELGHYVIDVDADLARKAIQSIGKMAVRLPEMSRPICYHLRTFLQHNIDYISTETVIVLKGRKNSHQISSESILTISASSSARSTRVQS